MARKPSAIRIPKCIKKRRVDHFDPPLHTTIALPPSPSPPSPPSPPVLEPPNVQSAPPGMSMRPRHEDAGG